MFGGKVKSVDDAAVLKRPGVKRVLHIGDTGVAVVADTWWRAKTALDALKIEWDEGVNANASSASFATRLKDGLEAKDAVVGNSVGDAPAAILKLHARSKRCTPTRIRTMRAWKL